MVKRASIDANGLLRLLLNDIPAQAQAVTSLLRQGFSFDVADMIIAELVYVLRSKDYGFSRQETSLALSRILQDPQFHCNSQLFQAALQHYVSRPALSFVNCYAVFYAQLNDTLPLYTFDKKLINQSSGLAKIIA